MVKEHKISVSMACAALKLPRSTKSYKSLKKRTDDEIIEQLQFLTEKHPTIGFWQSYFRLRKTCKSDNHKRIYRIYTQMKLNMRRRFKKRLPESVK